MQIAGGRVTGLHELIPVSKAVESRKDQLGVGQCEVVYALFSVGKIEKLIADEVANLLMLSAAMKEIVEARGRLRISRVVDGDKIFCDTTVLLEVWRL